ncbi:MAG: hypothetical protein PHS00_01755, partial [Candidatus Pacebacteria bacterium]|nr:hypothetical protein [Candidatus Paceibacterota bacterium]
MAKDIRALQEKETSFKKEEFLNIEEPTLSIKKEEPVPVINEKIAREREKIENMIKSLDSFKTDENVLRNEINVSNDKEEDEVVEIKKQETENISLKMQAEVTPAIEEVVVPE